MIFYNGLHLEAKIQKGLEHKAKKGDLVFALGKVLKESEMLMDGNEHDPPNGPLAAREPCKQAVQGFAPFEHAVGGRCPAQLDLLDRLEHADLVVHDPVPQLHEDDRLEEDEHQDPIEEQRLGTRTLHEMEQGEHDRSSERSYGEDAMIADSVYAVDL